MSQLSTAFSDLVLAAASVYGILQMTAKGWDTYVYAVIGYALVWIAAVAGMIRFGINSPPDIIVTTSRHSNKLVSTTAMALIGAQFLQVQAQDMLAMVLAALAAISAISYKFINQSDNQKFKDGVFIVTAVALGYCCFLTKSIYGTVGTVLLVLARFKSDLGDTYVYNYLRAASMVLFYFFLLNDKSFDGIFKRYFA